MTSSDSGRTSTTNADVAGHGVEAGRGAQAAVGDAERAARRRSARTSRGPRPRRPPAHMRPASCVDRVVLAGDLHAAGPPVDRREAVDEVGVAAPELPDEDRGLAPRGVGVIVLEVEPELHLPVDGEQRSTDGSSSPTHGRRPRRPFAPRGRALGADAPGGAVGRSRTGSSVTGAHRASRGSSSCAATLARAAGTRHRLEYARTSDDGELRERARPRRPRAARTARVRARSVDRRPWKRRRRAAARLREAIGPPHSRSPRACRCRSPATARASVDERHVPLLTDGQPVIRVSPGVDPSACGGAHRSRLSTSAPARARLQGVALPVAPRPMTMTSCTPRSSHSRAALGSRRRCPDASNCSVSGWSVRGAPMRRRARPDGSKRPRAHSCRPAAAPWACGAGGRREPHRADRERGGRAEERRQRHERLGGVEVRPGGPRIATSIATPSTLPIWRDIVSTAEPVAKRAGGSEDAAALASDGSVEPDADPRHDQAREQPAA